MSLYLLLLLLPLTSSYNITSTLLLPYTCPSPPLSSDPIDLFRNYLLDGRSFNCTQGTEVTSLKSYGLIAIQKDLEYINYDTSEDPIEDSTTIEDETKKKIALKFLSPLYLLNATLPNTTSPDLKTLANIITSFPSTHLKIYASKPTRKTDPQGYSIYKNFTKLLKQTEVDNISTLQYSSDCLITLNGLQLKNVCGGSSLPPLSSSLGLPIKSSGLDFEGFIKVFESEEKLMEKLGDMNVDKDILYLEKKESPVRWDVARGLSNYTFYLNDIEKDPQYQSLPSSTLEAYLNPYSQTFPAVKRNIITTLISAGEGEIIYQLLRSYPIRINTFLPNTKRGNELVCVLNKLKDKGLGRREVNAKLILSYYDSDFEDLRKFGDDVGIDLGECEDVKRPAYFESLRLRNINSNYSYINGRRTEHDLTSIMRTLNSEVEWIKDKIRDKKITDTKPKSVLGWVTIKGVKEYIPEGKVGGMVFEVGGGEGCVFEEIGEWEYEVMKSEMSYINFYGHNFTYRECVTPQNLKDVITKYGNDITHYNKFFTSNSPKLKNWLEFIHDPGSGINVKYLTQSRIPDLNNHPSSLTSFHVSKPHSKNIISCYLDPITIESQRGMSICNLFSHHFNVKVFYTPKLQYAKYTSYSVPVNRYYGLKNLEGVEGLTSLEIDYSDGLDVRRSGGDKDVDSIRCGKECEIEVEYIVKGIVIHGQAYYSNKTAAKGLQISIYDERDEFIGDTRVMDNLGYWQLKVVKSGEYRIKGKGVEEVIKVEGLGGEYVFLNVEEGEEIASFQQDVVVEEEGSELETINIFSVCTGHLYERFMKIMMLSVTQR